MKENNNIKCVRNGCSFSANDMAPMLNHFNTCVLIDGETFYCNRCEYGPDTRVIIEEHIKATHSLGIIEGIDDKDFSESDEEAEVGVESSESEGESGDDESLDKDDEQDDEFADDDDDGWNTKGYKKKRRRDWLHNEVMLNSCLDRKGKFVQFRRRNKITLRSLHSVVFDCSVVRTCPSFEIVSRWIIL